MIKIYPAVVGSTSPSILGIEIDESVRGGFGAGTAPSAVVTVAASGNPVTAGGTTLQSLVFAVTLTYQPCGNCSETKVKTFAETITVAVPGAVTSVTPTIGTVAVSPSRTGCCGKAYGVEILTSVSIAFS